MQILTELRRVRPLVLNITNEVTMDFVANGLLAIGASPVMSKSIEELDELVSLASAVVINIGTLDDKFMKLATRAARIAKLKKKPLVLDPVGAGATSIRTRAATALLQEDCVSIIRGNASEIMALAGLSATTKGVDSTQASLIACDAAYQLARVAHAVVVSGEIDVVVGQGAHDLVAGGRQTSMRVVGMGCLLSAVVAAFHAVGFDAKGSALEACRLFKWCAEKADDLPVGSFKTAFLDQLYMAAL